MLDMPTRTIADPFARQIGIRLRDLRLEQGKSLAAMETASGVSKGHLSNIERGQVLVNIITLRNIAQGLGMQLVEVLAGVEDALLRVR
jgi:transcriptional regulator with XRE-family HTH domain